MLICTPKRIVSSYVGRLCEEGKGICDVVTEIELTDIDLGN